MREIETEITPEDFKAFQEYVMDGVKEELKQKQSSLQRYGFATAQILLLLLMISLFIRFDLHLPTLITTLFAFIAFVSLLAFHQKSLMKNLLIEMVIEEGTVLGKQRFFITEEGVGDERKFHQSFTKWQGVLSLETTEKYIYLFIDNSAAYIIPKKYFLSAIECRDFLRELEERMEN